MLVATGPAGEPSLAPVIRKAPRAGTLLTRQGVGLIRRKKPDRRLIHHAATCRIFPRNATTQMNILLIYSTTDGHTLQICRHLQAMLESQRHRVTLVALADSAGLDLLWFDKIVVGASIRYGKHRPELVAFLQRSGPLLATRPNAFFTVNLVARKPEKCHPDTNPYMVKLLKRLAWRPRQLAVFAGKVDYPRYGFFDRQIIRFIMWMTSGPTGRRDVVDFTDWAQVSAFAQVIDRM